MCAEKPWRLPSVAVPEEVATLRRALKIHLRLWSSAGADRTRAILPHLAGFQRDQHVGRGTPSIFVVSMHGTHLRIEIDDPDSRALPTLVDANDDAESGRGMAPFAACSDRWGVQPLSGR
ncbi:hypothetical protein [Streptomyces sp. P10-4]|uniref:hypothetical protein n=1 Tax=Streptomyces sp. P10-4 TaxID=3421645 RepID=UPI003D2A5A39